MPEIFEKCSLVEKSKKRGPLLTIWLILMLIANAATALIYLLLGNSATIVALSNTPSWMFEYSD